MKSQERRGAYANGDPSDSFWTEEERPEPAEQPVPQRPVRRPLASTTQDDPLLLQQEILRDHRAHATGAAQLRGHDGQLKQGEQEVLHARDSVGQPSAATQRCLKPGFSERIGNSRRTGDRPKPLKLFIRGRLDEIKAACTLSQPLASPASGCWQLSGAA